MDIVINSLKCSSFKMNSHPSICTDGTEAPNFLTMLTQIPPVASGAGYPAVWGGKVVDPTGFEPA